MTTTFCVTDLSCVRQNKLLFANLSFSISAGEILLIEGPNGSGKSSLLKLLTGMSSPAHGDVCWQNQSIQSSADYLLQLHFIGHVNGIKLGLTVLENIALMQKLYSANSVEIDSVLTNLQLIEDKNTLAKHLSAGQQRRLALSKLFLFPRALWILDEPFTALDMQTQTLLTNALAKHVAQGGIAIVSSHHAITLSQTRTQSLRLAAC
jgi:heme exporter protein A